MSASCRSIRGNEDNQGAPSREAIGLGAVLGLPIAARFVFDLTGTSDGGGSAAQSMAVALGLSAGIVLLVGLSSCLVPTRRILAIQASEAMHADG